MPRKRATTKPNSSTQVLQQTSTLARQVFIDTLWSGYFVILPIIELIVTNEKFRNEVLSTAYTTVGDLFKGIQNHEQVETSYVISMAGIEPLFLNERHSIILVKQAAEALSHLSATHSKHISVVDSLTPYKHELFSIIYQGLFFIDRYGEGHIQTERYVQQASAAFLLYCLISTKKLIPSLLFFDTLRMKTSRYLMHMILETYDHYEKKKEGLASERAMYYFQQYLKNMLCVGNYTPVTQGFLAEDISNPLPPNLRIEAVDSSDPRACLKKYISALGNLSSGPNQHPHYRSKLTSVDIEDSLSAFCALVTDMLSMLPSKQPQGIFSIIWELDYCDPIVSNNDTEKKRILSTFQLMETLIPQTKKIYCVNNQLSTKMFIRLYAPLGIALLLVSINMSNFVSSILSSAGSSRTIDIFFNILDMAAMVVFISLGSTILKSSLNDLNIYRLAYLFAESLKSNVPANQENINEEISTISFDFFREAVKKKSSSGASVQENTHEPRLLENQTPARSIYYTEQEPTHSSRNRIKTYLYKPIQRLLTTTQEKPRAASKINWTIGEFTYSTMPEKDNNEIPAYPVYFQDRHIYYSAWLPWLDQHPIILKILTHSVIYMINTKRDHNGLKVLAQENKTINKKTIKFILSTLKINKSDDRIVNDGILHPSSEMPDQKPLLLFTEIANHKRVKNLAQNFPSFFTTERYKEEYGTVTKKALR